jgi:hypothetical protein
MVRTTRATVHTADLHGMFAVVSVCRGSRAQGQSVEMPCIYCPHEVTYIIDFSRSVNSPEKRAAWKAAFLKPQEKLASAGGAAILAPPDVKKLVRSHKPGTDAKLGRIEWL